MTDGAAIALQGLTKRYGTRRGIEDVSLTVPPGEVFGFLGPNGAGKTTTIRTMLDLLRPSAGRATLLGLDSHDDAVSTSSTGYLPGDFVAYRRMTGRRYLEFFAEVRDVPFGRVESLSRRFASDLEPQIDSLSHGNAQKLGLIQALMCIDPAPDPRRTDPGPPIPDPACVPRADAGDRGGGQDCVPLLPRPARGGADVRSGGDHRRRKVAGRRGCRRPPSQGDPGARVPFREAGAGHRVRDSSPIWRSGESVRCSVRGPVDSVLKAAARYEVVDLRSHEPGLEELFLEYYPTAEEASSIDLVRKELHDQRRALLDGGSASRRWC